MTGTSLPARTASPPVCVCGVFGASAGAKCVRACVFTATSTSRAEYRLQTVCGGFEASGGAKCVSVRIHSDQYFARRVLPPVCRVGAFGGACERKGLRLCAQCVHACARVYSQRPVLHAHAYRITSRVPISADSGDKADGLHCLHSRLAEVAPNAAKPLQRGSQYHRLLCAPVVWVSAIHRGGGSPYDRCALS